MKKEEGVTVTISTVNKTFKKGQVLVMPNNKEYIVVSSKKYSYSYSIKIKPLFRVVRKWLIAKMIGNG